MNEDASRWQDLVVPLGLGAAALGWCLHRGWWRRTALRDVPPRRAGLHLFDLLVGWALLLVGGVVFLPLRERIVGVIQLDAAGQPLHPLSAGQTAALALWSQATTLLPAGLYVLLRAGRGADGLTELGVALRRLPRGVGVGLLGFLLVVPQVMALLVLAQWFSAAVLHQPPPAVGHEMLQALLDSDSPLASAAIIFSAVIAAPVLEELFFRGLVQTTLLEWDSLRRRRWVVVFLSAALFTSMHLQMPWQTLAPLFLLAVGLGWLYERTGSLWPGMTLHAGFNFANVLLALLAARP